MKLFPRDDFSCPNNIFDISELAYFTQNSVKYSYFTATNKMPEGEK